MQRNGLRADLIRCRRRLFGAAEHFMALLLGYWGNNMVIRLDGWGLAGWIFIGVSMEKEWPGRRCLGVRARVWRQRLRSAGEIRPYVTGAHAHLVHYRYQKTPESAAVIPSFTRAQTHTHVSSTSDRGQRFPDASLCSAKADSSEAPDLVYLIDSYPAGHLYKTYNTGIRVRVCVRVCVCVCAHMCTCVSDFCINTTQSLFLCIRMYLNLVVLLKLFIY